MGSTEIGDFSPRPLLRARLLFAALCLCVGLPLAAQAPEPAALSGPAPGGVPQPGYVDLVTLSDSAEVVARVRIRKQVPVEPERSPGLRPGHVRLYVEADIQALLAGPDVLGQAVRYLVDVPLDARGKAPKLKKLEFILFADQVEGSPGSLVLVSPDAHMGANPALVDRLRSILQSLVDPFAPPNITGVRDSLSVNGNLAGEWETQIFLTSREGMPVSISVIHRPGMSPQWGASWSEIVDQAARPPARDTLEWYRLACFLPDELPARANLATNAMSRQQAAEDYQLVRAQLGSCRHTLEMPPE